jgi:hypothetical protein
MLNIYPQVKPYIDETREVSLAPLRQSANWPPPENSDGLDGYSWLTFVYKTRSLRVRCGEVFIQVKLVTFLLN